MKRNLIKGSAGNVSPTRKIRRINCCFPGSKPGLEGERGWLRREGEAARGGSTRESSEIRLERSLIAGLPEGWPSQKSHPVHP